MGEPTEFYRYFLPFCLVRRTDGRWLPLNRNYKPLGQLSAEWVDYDRHPGSIPLTQTLEDELSFQREPHRIWLYAPEEGLETPRQQADYWKKIQLLMTIPVD